MLKYSEYESRDQLYRPLVSLGHITPQSCKIWVRFSFAAKYYLVWSTSPFEVEDRTFETDDLSQYFDSSLDDRLVDHNTDLTALFQLDQLSPDTKYYYGFFRMMDENHYVWVKGHHESISFRTDALQTNVVKFALYSCHDPEHGKFEGNAWKHLHDYLNISPVDFIIAGGDQMYIDSSKSEHHNFNDFIRNNRRKILDNFPQNNAANRKKLIDFLLDGYRCNYRHYLDYKYLQKVQANYPSYSIWDDHEILDGWGSHSRKMLSKKMGGDNSAATLKENNELGDAMFRAASLAFSEYQSSKNPDEGNDISPEGEVGQVHFTFDKAFASFFVMDMRGHREYRNLEDESDQDELDEKLKTWILGPEQHQDLDYWIKDKCADPDTEVLFIISPVPVYHWGKLIHYSSILPAAKDDIRDEWDAEPNHFERDVFLNKIFEQANQFKKPVIFLSGDVHCTAVYRLWRKDKPHANVFQMTCSGITRGAAPGGDIPISNKAINYSQYKLGKKPPKKERVRAERLLFEYDNNFGFIRCEKTKDGVKVNGTVITYGPGSDLYGVHDKIDLNPK